MTIEEFRLEVIFRKERARAQWMNAKRERDRETAEFHSGFEEALNWVLENLPRLEVKQNVEN